MENKVKIITHQRPDVDAVAGVYLYAAMNGLKENIKIDYLPAVGDVYVDCSPSIVNGEVVEVYDHHQKNSPYNSATEAVFMGNKSKINDNDQLQAYKELVEAINLLDGAKFPSKEYMPVLINSFVNGMHLSLTKKEDFWIQIFKYFDFVFSSILLSVQSKKIPYSMEVVNGWKVVYYKLGEGQKANPSQYYFQELAVDFVIYSQGNNVGIVRNSSLTSPSLEGLKDYLQEDGWFFHPQGFIASWGSFKHPAKAPSKYSLQDLVEVIKKFLPIKGM